MSAIAKSQPPESKCRQRLRQGLREQLFAPPQPRATGSRPGVAVPESARPFLSQYTEMDSEHVAEIGPERTLAWRPADASSILDEVHSPVKLLLFQGLAPGDAVMLSAAVRDLKLAWGSRFLVDVRTPYPEIFANNPHLSPLHLLDPEVVKVRTHYTYWIRRINELPVHFVSAIRMDLEQRLGLVINQGPFRGDLHFTDEELRPPNLAEKALGDRRYWVIDAGGKWDFTVKWWETARYQSVVERLRDICFVQIGRNDHPHPRLKGDNVLNLIGQTNLRELMRVIYGAEGVITPISLPMHVAAAVPVHPRTGRRPHCVVLAGGREPPNWEQYPAHAYLNFCGRLKCCPEGGCTKSRVEALQDGRAFDGPDKLCQQPVRTDSGQVVARCMTMITVDDVVRCVRECEEARR